MSVHASLIKIKVWLNEHYDHMEKEHVLDVKFLEQVKVLREGTNRLFGQMEHVVKNAAAQVDELAARNIQMASFIQGIAENEQGDTGQAARHFLMMLARDAIPDTNQMQ